jgi:deazaflavin-dependent oxidoreductase (nitroreductase family)
MTQTLKINPVHVHPEVKKFPAEGTNLARILSDPQHRKSFHIQLKRYNPMIVTLYRSGLLPLFGVSRTVMLLTTRGNKSGKLRTTPIGYFWISGSLYLFSAWGKNTGWYKNMVAHPNEIWIQVGMCRRSVHAFPQQDPEEIKLLLAQLINESPNQARYLFGWDPANDQMKLADFSQITDNVLIVRFEDA